MAQKKDALKDTIIVDIYFHISIYLYRNPKGFKEGKRKMKKIEVIEVNELINELEEAANYYSKKATQAYELYERKSTLPSHAKLYLEDYIRKTAKAEAFREMSKMVQKASFDLI